MSNQKGQLRRANQERAKKNDQSKEGNQERAIERGLKEGSTNRGQSSKVNQKISIKIVQVWLFKKGHLKDVKQDKSIKRAP